MIEVNTIERKYTFPLGKASPTHIQKRTRTIISISNVEIAFYVEYEQTYVFCGNVKLLLFLKYSNK